MPNRDNNDNEPQRRRRPDGEHQPQRPTRDRPDIPGFNPQFPNDANLPAGPNDRAPRGDREPPRQNRAPDLDRANPNDTRNAAARAGQGIPGEMRGWLDNLRRLDRPGDMSDEEARRLAGLDDETGEPRPQQPETLPALVNTDLAHIANELDPGGRLHPKWHSIAHLPGFQNRQVRGMGQDIFSLFTRTPHQDILTIANIMGNGPNSEREIKAVLGWLKSNAEEMPEAHLDYSQAGMPGYRPRVKEYRTENTRFHVVNDQAGWYIYAYPEQDSVTGEGQAELGYDEPDHLQLGFNDTEEPERDEYGAKIKKLKEGTQMKFNSISEEIRYFTENLERVQRSALLESWNNEILEALLDESTLSKMIGNTPGGQSLVRYLHRQHKLGNMAEYETVPLSVKNVAVSIKRNRDNFAICVGTHGVAGVKPLEADWNNSNNPERDGTMRYVLVWATADAPAEQEIRKFRFGRTDATGGTSGMEGGAPNIFQVIRDRIGPLQAFYRAPEALERGKMSTRADLKKPDYGVDTTGRKRGEQDVVGKISSRFGQTYKDKASGKDTTIYTNMLNQTMGDVTDQIVRLTKGGNMAQAQKLIAAAAELQQISTALDSSEPRWDASPLRKLPRVIKAGIDKMTQGGDRTGVLQALDKGDAQHMLTLLNNVREQLYTIQNVSNY